MEKKLNQEEILEKSENLEITDLLKEKDDKYLRLFADFENYKRRSFKDKQDIVQSTKTNMLSSILDMDSDISIAMGSVTDEVREGFSIIFKKMENFLKSQNIEVIQTESYDDEIHDVVGINNSNNDNIFAVVSKGYKMDGKIIRHPKVILGV